MDSNGQVKAEGTPLQSDASVLRAIDAEHIRKDTLEIAQGAFKVRANGKDDNGLSVTEEIGRTAAQLEQVTGKVNFCSLPVEAVRRLRLDAGESAMQLDVVSAPRERDVHHCLITGTPKAQSEMGYKRRVAELLAAAACRFVPEL